MSRHFTRGVHATGLALLSWAWGALHAQDVNDNDATGTNAIANNWLDRPIVAMNPHNDETQTRSNLHRAAPKPLKNSPPALK